MENDKKPAAATTEQDLPRGNPTATKEDQARDNSNPSAINHTSPTGFRERRFRQTTLPAHFVERRKRPRIQTEPPPPPAPPRIGDYASIIGMPELDEIRFLARHLKGKTVKMVNSTAVGGGVAEILNRLVPLMNELEIPTRWEV